MAAWDMDAEPDDYDAAMPGGDADYHYDDIDSEILDSLVILGLTAALAFLIYYRGRRQRVAEEERRQEEQRQMLANQVAAMQQQPAQAQPQPQQQDRGMFPHPNDPAFMDWAAGAVGH
jgi:SEL1 protein